MTTELGTWRKVGLDQFYGIEIEGFPARIAETAMYLMDHLENEALGHPSARKCSPSACRIRPDRQRQRTAVGVERKCLRQAHAPSFSVTRPTAASTYSMRNRTLIAQISSRGIRKEAHWTT